MTPPDEPRTDPRTDPDPDAALEGAADARDRLISRIIDARAEEGDWRSFRSLAERDPGVWRDLAGAQRQHELLCEGVRAAAAAADGVGLPLADPRPLERRLDGVARWGGWAAAAALVLVWATGLRPGAAEPRVQAAGIGPLLHDATPDQALDRYIDAGRSAGLVVGEVPERVVVETRPRPDGSVEVVYLRQIVERRVTDRVYREVTDDTGRRVPVAMPASEFQVIHAY